MFYIIVLLSNSPKIYSDYLKEIPLTTNANFFQLYV